MFEEHSKNVLNYDIQGISGNRKQISIVMLQIDGDIPAPNMAIFYIDDIFISYWRGVRDGDGVGYLLTRSMKYGMMLTFKMKMLKTTSKKFKNEN